MPYVFFSAANASGVGGSVYDFRDDSLCFMTPAQWRNAKTGGKGLPGFKAPESSGRQRIEAEESRHFKSPFQSRQPLRSKVVLKAGNPRDTDAGKSGREKNGDGARRDQKVVFDPDVTFDERSPTSSR